MNFYTNFKEKKVVEKIIEHLRAYMNGHNYSVGNKVAMQQLFTTNESAVNKIFEDAFAEEFNKWKADVIEAYEIKREYKEKADELKKMTEQVDALRREKAELENKYPDPRARQAVVLWKEMMKPYYETDNDYIKRNAVHSAGSIVAAYLGEKDIPEGPLAEMPKEETEKKSKKGEFYQA